MKGLDVGKVYRVTELALDADNPHNRTNRSAVRNHGYLWVCNEKYDRGSQWCRSVANGYVYAWGSDEMEEVR